MRDVSSWSLKLHRWWGVSVRLHAYFLMWGVLVLYWASHTGPAGFGYGCLGLGILFFSVVLHEVGHCAAAFKVGGSIDQVIIGPCGGLTQPQVLHDSHQELFAALGGPAVNFLIWAVTGPLVMIAGGSVVGLLHPLEPHELLDGNLLVVSLKLTYWINWLLVLVNLLPVQPLDGLRVFRSLFWMAFDYRHSVLFVSRGAQILAGVFCLAAWLSASTPQPQVLSAWLPLSLAAIYLYFGGKQEMARLEEQDLDDDLFSYDFSQGYTSLERHYDGPKRKGGKLRSWIERRRTERRQRQADIERDEELQVDEILARLHEKGLDGLSAKERALLNRVSARFRNRQGS
jgi:Zn-dependent protease